MNNNKKNHIARRILLGFAILVIGATVLGVAFAGKIWQLVDTKASAKLGRNFSIDGGASVDWDWTNPFIHLKGIKLANLPQSKDPEMVSIDEIDFHIKFWDLFKGQLNLPDISFQKPVIILEQFDKDTANWDFPTLSAAHAVAKGALPSKRSNFPILGNIAIHEGKLVYRDSTKKLDVSLGIDTAEGGGGEQGAFIFSGNGLLQNKPFVVKAQGGSLGMLRNSNVVYPLNFHIKMGDTLVDMNGTFADPVQMKGIDTQLSLSGKNLADLFYLTAIPLPPTPPYALKGHLVKNDTVWSFEAFKGKVGSSDLEGNLSYDVSNPRGFVKADLTSHLLDMKDLAGFVGATAAAKPGSTLSAEQKSQVQKEEASPNILPDVPVDLTRLRTTDMEVRFKATQILAPGLPINDMDITLNLKDGILRLDPFSFGIAAGQLSGSILLDGQKDIPHVETDLTLAKLSLKKFFGDSSFAALTNGYFGGHYKIEGNGSSLAKILADSNGSVTMVMSGGTMSQLIVDAAGLDFGRAAPILLSKDKPTQIRCAVGDFALDDGILNSKIFVFDTSISNIAGEAQINLKNETINAKIRAEPKKPSITAHAGITVSGKLKHPSIGLDAQEAAERGAAAAVLSVFLTPIAAIIPFIETGVGKDSDCTGLINEARSSAADPIVKN